MSVPKVGLSGPSSPATKRDSAVADKPAKSAFQKTLDAKAAAAAPQKATKATESKSGDLTDEEKVQVLFGQSILNMASSMPKVDQD